MAINLNDLSAMLDEHFRLAPPLDSKNVPVSGAISEYGTGVSLGDGTSMEGVRGLENIQVVEKANYLDKVRQISMKDWLEKTIKKNPDPEKVAASLQGLLENGQVSYFEQGREFATQLNLNSRNKKLGTTAIKREELPPVKPTLTFGQKFLRLFNWLPQDELDNYNRALLSYEVQKKALATSEVRAPIGVGTAPTHDDGKGRIIAGEHGNEADLIRNADLHYSISQLPPQERRDAEYSILTGENLQEAKELQIGPSLNWSKFTAEMYPNGKPSAISNVQDHINARIAKQDHFHSVRTMKEPRNQSLAASQPNYLTANALTSVMVVDGKYNSAGLDSLATSKAFKDLFGDYKTTTEQIATGKIFDQFAQNLERNPIKGVNAQEIENLLDVCIQPHKKLTIALEASKNPEMLKAANNKQPEKQMEKEAPKINASAPKMG